MIFSCTVAKQNACLKRQKKESVLTKEKHMKTRCSWVGNSTIYRDYHDHEWGKPEYDSLKLFEKICLEGQQAGLSWLTVLKKT